MSGEQRPGSHERWAHLRFSVVGSLLASPPARGELRAELARLAEKAWRHPQSGALVRFGLSTIERWYYAARAGTNPVAVLRRELRQDSGRFLAITDTLAQALRRQHAEPLSGATSSTSTTSPYSSRAIPTGGRHRRTRPCAASWPPRACCGSASGGAARSVRASSAPENSTPGSMCAASGAST